MGNKTSKESRSHKSKSTKYSPIDVPFDLSIFNNAEIKQCSLSMNFQDCMSIKRLLCGLQYYTSLDIKNNSKNKDIFIHFMKEVYKSLILDDFYHLIQIHQQQLHDIKQYAVNNKLGPKKCDIMICNFSSRHHKSDDNLSAMVSNYAQDKYLNFHIEIMDSLHFYIFHLYETSFRIIQQDVGIQEDDNTVECFDANFSRINKIVENSRATTARFSRISNKSNKFTIGLNDRYNDTEYDQNDGDKFRTYIDLLISDLYMKDINKGDVYSLDIFIKQQEYDTDSLEMDMQIDNGNGNILKAIKNRKIVDAVIARFKQSRGMSLFLSLFSFSIMLIK